MWQGCAGCGKGDSTEGGRWCFGGDSERPINFSRASGMTVERFSKGAKGKVSHTWLCGPGAGFSSHTGTGGLCSSTQFGDRRLGGSWERPSSVLGLFF